MNNEEIHELLKIQNDETTIFTNQELKMIDDYIKELEAYKYNMDRDYLRLEEENQRINGELREENKRLYKTIEELSQYQYDREGEDMMNKEEIEELKEFTIDLTDIDELALGLEICSKKSNMVIQEFADIIIQLQQENKKYKEVINKLKTNIENDIDGFRTINEFGESQAILELLDVYLDILKEVE